MTKQRRTFSIEFKREPLQLNRTNRIHQYFGLSAGFLRVGMRGGN